MKAVAIILCLFVAASTAVPAQSLEGFPAEDDRDGGSRVGRFVQVDPVDAAWSVDLGISLAAGKGKTTPTIGSDEQVCALGDVDGDGHDDLLFRFPKGKSGKYEYQALAGPDLTEVLWKSKSATESKLACASDSTGDAVADPIIANEATDTEVEGDLAPASQTDATSSATDVVDGSDGASLTHVDAVSSTESLDPTYEKQVRTDVTPAGEGALLVVEETTTTQGDPDGLLGGASSSHTDVAVEVITTTGETVGRVETRTDTDAVAVAPVPGEPGAPDVVVLTEANTSPIVDQPVAQPTVTVYSASGVESWSIDHDSTTGAPLVLPDVGDVDGDGVDDLIYATIPHAGGLIPEGRYTVLSGADGSTILESEDVVDGFVSALPFGDLTGDGTAEVLVVQRLDEAMTLSAVDADGSTLWTSDVLDDVTPINLVIDHSTGNTIGFSDLTGDGLPDVAVQRSSEDGIFVQAVDGATGGLLWEGAYDGADDVASQAGPDDVDDLILVDTDAGLNVTSLDGATGTVLWTNIADGDDTSASSIKSAGDVDGDGVDDVVVTIEESTPTEDPDAPSSSSSVISGRTGSTILRSEQGSGPTEGEGSASTGSLIPATILGIPSWVILVTAVVAAGMATLGVVLMRWK